MPTPNAYAIATTYQDYDYIIAAPLCERCSHDRVIVRELSTGPVRIVPIVCHVPNRSEACHYCSRILIPDAAVATDEVWRGNVWDYATDTRP